MASKLESKRQSTSEDKHRRAVTSWQQQTTEGVVVGGPWGHDVRLSLRGAEGTVSGRGWRTQGLAGHTEQFGFFTKCERKPMKGLSCR